MLVLTLSGLENVGLLGQMRLVSTALRSNSRVALALRIGVQFLAESQYLWCRTTLFVRIICLRVCAP